MPPTSPPTELPATGVTAAAESGVPMREKIGYGLGSIIDVWCHWLYPTVAFQIFGLALHVPVHWIGTALILNRLFEAVSDPWFAWMSDNTRTRFGRRRPYLLVGSILSGVGLPFLLAVWPGWSAQAYFTFMIVSSAIYLPLVSCFNLPYRSLGNELTADYHERTAVFCVQNIIRKAPEFGLFVFGYFFSMRVWVGAETSNLRERLLTLCTSFEAWLPAPAGAAPNTLLGGQVYLALCGAVCVIAGIVCVSTVRERYYSVAQRSGARVNLREALWQTLECRPFRSLVLIQLTYNIGLSMVGTLGFATTIYYVCRGDKAEANSWNCAMGVAGMLFGLLGVPVFAAIAKRFGKRVAMGAVLAGGMVASIATWWLYTPHLVWLQVLACGLIAFTGGGYWTLDPSLRADVVDFDELSTGKRREGAFEGSIAWIGKVGMAIGAGASFYVLDWIGFDTAAAQQSSHTVLMIRLLLATIPLVGLTLALIALAQFPLNRENAYEIRRELERRRGSI